MSTSAKSVSDSTLYRLWRRAVLAYWGYRDPISGVYDPSGERFQCHHYVRRRRYLLRWDHRNGIPLTPESHRFAHTGAGEARVRALLDSEYLDDMERWDKKEWLATQSMTDAEFRREKRAELQAVIDEYGGRL